MNRIFVQIASYRDLELLPTIRDIIAKSSGENELSFAIIWQKDDSETIGEYSKDSRFRIIDCDWRKSRGLGWARSLAQSLYKDEEYTLQLDSHHRFEKDWDKKLIDMIKQVSDESKKPLLTAYAAGYDPNDDKKLTGAACRISPRDFKKSGTIWFNPNPIPNQHLLTRPVRGRLVSGHYFFTYGSHCKEYIYDPDMYFAGDEICLSVRSYTLGYDIYHPHINLVYHHYGRLDRSKHWNDHNIDNKTNNQIEKTWGERDKYSKERIRQLLGEEDNGIDLGIFGLGKVRSIDEYEKYSGIDFKKRRIQKCAINGDEPPVSFATELDYENDFKKITTTSIPEWNKEQFINTSNIAKKFNIQYINLQRNCIFNQTYPVDYISNTSSISNLVEADHTPMKVILTSLDQNNNIICRVEKDLQSHIHWN